MFDKWEDDEGLAKCERVGFFFFFLSAEVRDGNSSSRQSRWLLAMSNCFVLDATWARQCSLSLSHMHTHPLGSAPDPHDGLGGAKLFLLFTSLRNLQVCKVHVCTWEPPTAWKHTGLHWKACKIADGNVLNVRKVESVGKEKTCLRELLQFSEVSIGLGKFRGQICVHVW